MQNELKMELSTPIEEITHPDLLVYVELGKNKFVTLGDILSYKFYIDTKNNAK